MLSVDVILPGLHIFGFIPLYIKSGLVYSATWQSETKVQLYVSEDFSFDKESDAAKASSASGLQMSDGQGEFSITLQRLKKA